MSRAPTQPPRRNPDPRPQAQTPTGWYQRLCRQLDLAGQIAERLEPSFKSHWVPLTLLTSPFLLLLLAMLVAYLR